MCLFTLMVNVGQFARKFKLVEWRSSIYSKEKSADVLTELYRKIDINMQEE